MTQKQARDIIILLVVLIGAVGYNAYVNSRPTVVWYQELTPEPDLTATALMSDGTFRFWGGEQYSTVKDDGEKWVKVGSLPPIR